MKMHSVNAVKDLTVVILKICFCKYRLRQIDKISVRMHLKPHMSPGTAIHADNTARACLWVFQAAHRGVCL